MSTVYVVRLDQRGISAHEGWGIEHAHMTTPMIDIFSVDLPFLQTTVQRCIVRPNSVCEHGWFCTDNYKVAAMVDKLRGERPAMVAWLREVSERRFPRNEREQGIVFRLAHEIERGEHRREEER